MPHVIFGREYPSKRTPLSSERALWVDLRQPAGARRHEGSAARATLCLGGFCSTFRRKGFVFDAATHFYPLLGNPATLTGKLLQAISKSPPHGSEDLDPVGPVPPSRRCRPFRCPPDFDRYLEQLLICFPHRGGHIDAYFPSCARLASTACFSISGEWPTTRRSGSEKVFMLTQMLDEYFHDPRLKAF